MCIIKTGVMNMDYTLMLCGKDAFSYFFLSTWRRTPRSWAKWKKPAKKSDEEIRVIDCPYLYLWNSLTNFQHEAMTGNGNQLNLLKTRLKKTLEITSSLQGIYFQRVLVIWNHCALPRPTPLPTSAASTPSPSQSVGAIFSMASMHS